MLMSAYDLDQLSRNADLYGITFCEKTDSGFLDKLRVILSKTEQREPNGDCSVF